MEIEDFSFGSIRIDGTTHEHDVVIEGGDVASARKGPRRNSATTLDTPRCLWRRKFHGSADAW
jgi:hypothetical protein